MSYCINPKCRKRQNPNELEYCQACGSSLIINECYRLIKPLRELEGQHSTEIFEVDNWGTTKVLKVLTSNSRRLVKLFQQEAEVLQRLKHLGIPKVDTYFIFSPRNGPKELHCLVMEKISGQNLKQWLEENEPIPEALAVDWLRQLVNILAQLHQEQFLHRDIKPSNIMRRPEGQLVLIDFGAVREITDTYIRRLAGCDVTRVYSSGYTAPEQVNGQAVAESEFFALGRTFIHLLTGIYPDDLPKDSQTNRLIWRDSAPQISAFLADLIDELTAPLPQHRLHNPQVILDKLAKFSRSTRIVTIDEYTTEVLLEARAGLLGTLLDNRYQIQKVLGGSFGRTYLAADEQRFGELCVLKEIAPSNRVEHTVQKLHALFETEAKVLYQINHPQIPKFLACFAQMGRLFIVQEYIDGKTYADLLQERRQQGQLFSEAEAIQLLKDILPALTYLHERNLVHRDISTDNIMLPKGQSRPVLIDFGLVKQTMTQVWDFNPDSPNGSGQSIGGKFGYIPPEQIRVGQCYPCSDIYALGVTAVVLLTGKEAHLLMERETLDWQWHSYVKISDKLVTILDKMLAEKPRDRYQSAQDVLADLQAVAPPQAIAVPATPTKPHVESKPVGETNKNKSSRAVNPESKQQAEIQPQLNPTFLARCQQEFALRLGPMAKYVVEETLSQHPNISPSQLVEVLAAEIPDSQQAEEFKNSVETNSATQPEATAVTPISQPEAVRKSQVVAATPISQPEPIMPPQLNQAFLDRCQQELALRLGPMAKYILEKTLAQHPNITPPQLIKVLADEIPNPQQAIEFRQSLRP